MPALIRGVEVFYLRTTRLLAVAAVSALLTACNNGGATPPPFPPPRVTSGHELKTTSTFQAQNIGTGELVSTFPTREVIDPGRAADDRQ